jgi:CRISPR-associated exonuclease Cas4
MENKWLQFTGQQVKYYPFCKRRLWLFTKGVAMEKENEDVQKGELINEQSYSRAQKEIAIDDRIVIDWMESKVGQDGVLVLHEVKKSRAVESAHRLQMLYYIFYLQCKGVAARGEIDYPLLKKKELIELSPEAEDELLGKLGELEQIVNAPEIPPRLPTKRFCEKCAYYELCWS